MAAALSSELVHVSPDDRPWFERLGFRSVNQIMKIPAAGAVALSGTSDVVRVSTESAPGAPPLLFIKRYRYDRPAQRLRLLFRGGWVGRSRARFEFEFLEEMRRRGAPAVRPVAYGEKRRRGLLRAAFLATEGAVGAVSLDRWVDDVRRSGRIPAGVRRRLIDDLGSSVRALHAAGVFHGALFWRNILVRCEPSGRFAVAFIDPDTRGRFFAGQVPAAQAESDLADVAATALAAGVRGGITRLVRAYLSANRLTPSNRKRVRRLVGLARRRAKAEARRFAVAAGLERLRRHVSSARSRPPVHSAEEFASLLHARLSADAAGRADLGDRCVAIRLSAAQGGDGTARILLVDGRGVRIEPRLPQRTDLILHTDVGTWLAVVNGRADVYDLLRRGGLQVTGDRRLLLWLADRIG